MFPTLACCHLNPNLVTNSSSFLFIYFRDYSDQNQTFPGDLMLVNRHAYVLLVAPLWIIHFTIKVYTLALINTMGSVKKGC